MPTWPMDIRLRRRFSIRNAVLLLSVLAQALGAGKGTQDLMKKLSKIFSATA